MTNYTKNNNKRNQSLKKVILFLTYILILLIIFFIASMCYETLKSQDEKTKQAETTNPVSLTPDVTFTQNIESGIITEPTALQPSNTSYIVPEIPYGQPDDLGFSLDKINTLDNYIKEQIDAGFPGAVLMVAKDEHIVFHKAYGYSKKYDGMNLMSEFESMELDTMFDLASLSKIYGTTFSIMKLVDDGLISLDGKVSDYISNYTGNDKDKVTVKMLLTHSAGYLTDYKFYTNDSEYKTYDRNTVYEYVKQIPLDSTPGTTYKYKNMNYIILGMIVEEISGMRIDEYAKTNIYEPLGIENSVTYRPLDIGIEQSNIAATERLGNTRDGAIYFDGIRQYTIQGEVHDENTYYSMDQVSGHAGLFATSYGLTLLNQLLLNKGEYEGIRIYKEETVNNWLRTVNDKKYQLGFWNAKTASEKLESYVSDSTFYHNGWTGTAAIVDIENNLSIILLTNKRHSPCPEGDFQGLDYSIAYYTSVIQKVYDALE